MTDPTRPAASDSATSYDLAIAALRERGVREGRFAPVSDDERRQASEGPREPSQYDCLKTIGLPA